MNTNYRYVRRVMDTLQEMELVIPLANGSGIRGIRWELTSDGKDIGALLTNAERLLQDAFHNNYKR